jgi:hypothetical protein
MTGRARSRLMPAQLTGGGWEGPLSQTERALRAFLLLSFGAVLALEAYLLWQVVRLFG